MIFRYFILVVLFTFVPASASAARISLEAEPASVGVGDVVKITVLLESAVPVNAFSGTVSYPNAALEPIDVIDGNSLVNVWVTRPNVTNANGLVPYAGITPGGFSGTGGTLFSLLFRAKRAGEARVFLEEVEVLRNDGAGGNEPTRISSLTFSISPTPVGGYIESPDKTPPEPFTIYEGTDPSLFEGHPYIVFAAVDKGSGVDRYEVVETRTPSWLHRFFPPSWTEAASPYELRNANPTQSVYVKAVDRAGNERLATFPPWRLFTGYELLLLVILGVIALLSYRGWGRRFSTNP